MFWDVFGGILGFVVAISFLFVLYKGRQVLFDAELNGTLARWFSVGPIAEKIVRSLTDNPKEWKFDGDYTISHSSGMSLIADELLFIDFCPRKNIFNFHEKCRIWMALRQIRSEIENREKMDTEKEIEEKLKGL